MASVAPVAESPNDERASSTPKKSTHSTMIVSLATNTTTFVMGVGLALFWIVCLHFWFHFPLSGGLYRRRTHGKAWQQANSTSVYQSLSEKWEREHHRDCGLQSEAYRLEYFPERPSNLTGIGYTTISTRSKVHCRHVTMHDSNADPSLANSTTFVDFRMRTANTTRAAAEDEFNKVPMLCKCIALWASPFLSLPLTLSLSLSLSL